MSFARLLPELWRLGKRRIRSDDLQGLAYRDRVEFGCHLSQHGECGARVVARQEMRRTVSIFLYTGASNSAMFGRDDVRWSRWLVHTHEAVIQPPVIFALVRIASDPLTHRDLRMTNEKAMETTMRLFPGIQVPACRRLIEFSKDLLQGLHVCRLDARNRQTKTQGFQQNATGVQGVNDGWLKGRHSRTLIVFRLDQPFSLEHTQRLPQRNTTDAQRLGQLDLRKHRAGREHAIKNHCAQASVERSDSVFSVGSASDHVGLT